MELWNLPLPKVERVARSPFEVIPICEEYFGNRPIKILEIGVYKGGLYERLNKSRLNIVEYFGVDPYLGNESDPYFGSYWSKKDEADKIYLESKKKFEENKHQLFRMTSYEFFEKIKLENKYFDMIYVDGDHRYSFALWDFINYFDRVDNDGLFMVDDYANVDVVDVTRAFNDFAQLSKSNINKMGYIANWFVNAGKHCPIVQVTVYIQPVNIKNRVIITNNINPYRINASFNSKSGYLNKLKKLIKRFF